MPNDDRPASEDDFERDRPLRRPRRDDDEDERPRRRRSRPVDDDGVNAAEFLVPVNVSAWSIAACYFGLLSCVLPFIGLVLALVAFPSGIVALRRRRKNNKSDYGSITGDMRAVIGLISSGLTLVGYIVIGIIYLANLK